MSQPFELNRRARKILQAVVSEYLSSGDPVGSRTVTRRHDIGLSPATVRNVMSDLEDMGLLEQRHTSAGRVPTDRGLRFFIDALLKVRGLTPSEKDDIRVRVAGGPGHPAAPTRDDILSNASRLLSEITQHAAVIVAPDPSLLRFDHLEFVPLRSGKVICILVTTDGRIENKLLSLDELGGAEPNGPISIDERSLERIHNYLNGLLSGLTLDEIRDRVLRELSEDKHRYDREVAAALLLGQAAFGEPSKADVVVAGQSNLVDLDAAADRARIDRMRELLRTLEDKQLLVRLLDRTKSADGIQVFLGAETAHAALADSSIVAMAYGAEERPIGALAVIGPLRMNYGKVMSIVDFTADVVSELLTEL
jgi:heat-inducible transcriptional repressor